MAREPAGRSRTSRPRCRLPAPYSAVVPPPSASRWSAWRRRARSARATPRAARRHLSAYADAAPDDIDALLQLAALHRSAGAVEALAALLPGCGRGRRASRPGRRAGSWWSCRWSCSPSGRSTRCEARAAMRRTTPGRWRPWSRSSSGRPRERHRGAGAEDPPGGADHWRRPRPPPGRAGRLLRARGDRTARARSSPAPPASRRSPRCSGARWLSWPRPRTMLPGEVEAGSGPWSARPRSPPKLLPGRSPSVARSCDTRPSWPRPRSGETTRRGQRRRGRGRRGSSRMERRRAGWDAASEALLQAASSRRAAARGRAPRRAELAEDHGIRPPRPRATAGSSALPRHPRALPRPRPPRSMPETGRGGRAAGARGRAGSARARSRALRRAGNVAGRAPGPRGGRRGRLPPCPPARRRGAAPAGAAGLAPAQARRVDRGLALLAAPRDHPAAGPRGGTVPAGGAAGIGRARRGGGARAAPAGARAGARHRRRAGRARALAVRRWLPCRGAAAPRRGGRRAGPG